MVYPAPPIIHHSCAQNEVALAEFTRQLRNFRPSATVLEAEIASVKSTFGNPLLDAHNQLSKSNAVRFGLIIVGGHGWRQYNLEEGRGHSCQQAEVVSELHH